MAYDKEHIYNEAIKAIEENHLYFISDVVAYVPCVSSTFYEFFPPDSEESENIKELLNDNRISTKVKLRRKLENGDKAAEILALYKLIATEDERRALSMQHIDHTSKGDKMNVISLGNGVNPDETTS